MTTNLHTPIKNKIRELSDLVVVAQNPIRILDVVKWSYTVKKDFFKHKFKKLPALDLDYYQKK